MIPFLRFKHIMIDELCLYFDKPTDDQINDMYKIFQNTSEPILKRAAKLLKKSYKYKRFPFPADIEGAIDHARKEHTRDSTDPDVPREHCNVCYGMGTKLVERYDEFYKGIKEFAVPCHCREGGNIRRTWKEYYNKNKYHRTSAKITEIPQEGE